MALQALSCSLHTQFCSQNVTGHFATSGSHPPLSAATVNTEGHNLITGNVIALFIKCKGSWFHCFSIHILTVIDAGNQACIRGALYIYIAGQRDWQWIYRHLSQFGHIYLHVVCFLWMNNKRYILWARDVGFWLKFHHHWNMVPCQGGGPTV